ncbi:hypothetical protein OIDMADRAFT_177160 [Oidiodendron maius Zn]|uniref:2EXR domain-containing protein n=1 Tax=Oidiodendron maius (strain Zn) TaxID=913774 RepID=A0A0C3H972_OIDMZ|nr:hypothetical protein OIDMADRAFT_177160 [Oidiodendron maius Zn]
MTVRGNVPQYFLVPIQHPTNVEDRSRHIKNRLERLENGQKNLKSDQKWPTQKSMSLHILRQLNPVPEIIIQPPTPSQQEETEGGWTYSQPRTPMQPSPGLLTNLLERSLTPRPEFPYPVTMGPRRGPDAQSPVTESSFIYFTFLPLELRLQIWEMELKRPKFIEAQFSSQFYSPTFVGSCTGGSPLLSVCRESRELALCEDFAYLTPTQRDFGRKYVKIPIPHLGRAISNDLRWSRTPYVPKPFVAEKPLPFIPHTDTIFFRSLDRPQGGLQSLACNLVGFENIRHLALPLPTSGLPLRNEWKMCLSLFRNLDTLTFMVGCNEHSWLEDEEIELRDAEEWYQDGRARTVKVDKWLLDVSEVSPFLSSLNFEQRMRGSWDEDWKGINVRVVAWRKGCSD